MPGPAPGQHITAGTILGITKYDAGLYGIGIPPEYLVEPMTAASNTYTSVLVSWHPPSGIIFRYRLIRNRYGYPVNENDGDLIYDQTSYPGNSFTDLDVSQGTYHYYGFYVLVDIGDDIWIRSGFAGCLCIQDYGTGKWLFSLLPEYFTTIPQTGDPLVITDYATEDSSLQSYLNIIGWMLDYLRTQYATYADHLNDATFIPLDDLWNLAAQVGLTFSPDVPAHTVRKATENFAHVAQQRGTLAGIEEEIALRTGYGADVHMGPNIMLDDDQAQILSPVFVQYDNYHKYMRDDCVWVPYHGNDRHSGWNGDGWWYRCKRDNTYGHPPPAAGYGVSDQYWTAVYDYDDFLATQINIQTSNPGTWELLDTGAANFLPLPHSATQGLGVWAPPPIREADGNSRAWNCLRLYNRQASPRTIRCRSVCRRHIDLGQIPDSSFECGTTIPEPFRRHNRRWVPRHWPENTCANWLGGDDDISVTAYWTVINAFISRENTIASTGSWAMEVIPGGAAVAVPISSAPQHPNPSFESPAAAGWSGTNCNIRQSTTREHSGNFSLFVEPLFTVIENATWTITPTQTTGSIGPQFLWADLPFVTGPSLPAFIGATEAVSLYCYGSTVPNNAEATFPTVLPIIVFYDIAGNVLQLSEGSQVLLSGSWQQLSATGTAPAGAVTKALVVRTVDTTQTTPTVNNFWIDDVAWTIVTITESLQLNSPWVSCPPGTAITGSAYYQAASSGSIIIAQLGFYDVCGNLIGTITGAEVTGTASTWVNPATSGVSPAGTAYAELQLIVLNPVATAYVDDTTITPGLLYAIQPDQIQAVADGIPVPWVLDSDEWEPGIRYITNDIVSYDNQPFVALRASTGSLPPANDVASTDWAPLSQSHRIRLCLSAYVSQILSLGVNFSYATRAFIEWYDAQGNYITTVFARSAAGNGSVSQPGQMAYDSFTTQSIIASTGSAAYTLPLIGNWTVTFWNNIILRGEPVLRRHDPDVHFTWDGDSPGFGVCSSGWSASWVTSFTAPVPGTYGFELQAGGGGSRLIINGITCIDNWANQSGLTLTTAVPLTAGQVVTVEINYFNPVLEEITYSDDLIIAPGAIIVENLFDEVEPGYWGHREVTSFTCSPFRCRARDVAQVTEFSFSGTADLFVTASWLDIHGVCIGTSQQRFAAGDYDSLSCDFAAPDGCWEGSVSFAPDERHGFFRQHDHPDFHCRIGGRGEHGGPTCHAPVIVAAVNSNFIVHGLVQVPAVPPLAATYSNALAGRVTDDEQSNWLNPIASAWTVGGFAGGSVWPSNPQQQAIGLLTTQPANTSLGVTFRSMPAPGMYAGLVFRYTNTASYWRCDQDQLGFIRAGAYTLIAAHTTAFAAGDRMVVVLNGTSITVYRNGTQVNSATSTFNQAAIEHGIINDGAPFQLEEELALEAGGKPHRAAGNPRRHPKRGYAQGSWVPGTGSLYTGKYFRSS